MRKLDALWTSRHKALCDSIDSRIDEIEKRLSKTPIDEGLGKYDRQKIVATQMVLTRLCYFAKEIFTYFRDKDIEFGPKYSCEHVLSTILDQIGYDLETLSRIAHDQFTIGGRDILKKADFLAEEALKLAKTKNYLDQSPVILSYFQKSFSVRIIPYANVLMIGIPFSTRIVSQDFLAIPHEVGHYVYWKGVSKEGEHLRELISKEIVNNETKTSWLPRWTEEIFADIYGAYVGGPFIALSFQDLGLQNLPNDMVEDDANHPPTVLRPYLYAKALNKAGFTKSAGLLYLLWKRRLGEFRKEHEPIEREDRENRDFNSIYLANGSPYSVFAEDANGKGAIKDELSVEGNKQPVDFAIRKISELFGIVVDEELDIWRGMIREMEIVLDEENSHGIENNHDQLKEVAKDFLDEDWENATETTINKRLEDLQDSINKLFGVSIEGASDPEVNDDAFVIEMPDDVEEKLPLEFQEDISDWEMQGEIGWMRVWEAGGWTTEGPDCDIGSGSC